MAEKSVIIIGAGVAGLSAGIYCRMNGYPTRIFEHHTVPGGVASYWKRKGFLIDGGIHFVMGHKPGTTLHESYKELGILPGCKVVDMATYGKYADEASGKSVIMTADLDELARDLKAMAPQDGGIIDELVAGARAMQGLDMSTVGLSLPPEMTTFPGKIKEFWGMRKLWKYFSGKYAKPVEEYARTAKDPWLREFIKNLFLPEVPVWFILMILALMADGQMGFLEGGCLDFALALERRYKALGGEITYRATVKEILVENDAAAGVRLADGSERRAETIVSAADGRSTIFEMLGGRYVNDKIKKRYAEWKTFTPFVLVSYGLAREFPDSPAFITVRMKEALEVGGKSISGYFIRILNYSPRFAPPGKTVIQVEFESGWDYWNDLQKSDRAKYEAEKKRIAAEMLGRLEGQFPGISQNVEMIDVATPYTLWRYTLNHKASWEGWMITPDALKSQVERTLPGLSNFYMAGQWVMPGGGVPPCLFSGRHVAQLLCKRDRKVFKTMK